MLGDDFIALYFRSLPSRSYLRRVTVCVPVSTKLITFINCCVQSVSPGAATTLDQPQAPRQLRR